MSARSGAIVMHRLGPTSPCPQPLRDDRGRVKWWRTKAQAERSLRNRGLEFGPGTLYEVVSCAEQTDGRYRGQRPTPGGMA